MREPNLNIGERRSSPCLRSLLAAGVIACVLMALLSGSSQVVTAQQGTNGATSLDATTARKASSRITSDDRYRMGPGDIIEIRVFNRPILSRDTVRIDARGMIRMPLIEGEIQAACLTETELAQGIATRYLKYLKNPQIDVFVKEFESQPVAVIGAVNSPGRFRLQRQVRLLELLTFANGPADRAGQSLQIIHAEDPFKCEKASGVGSEDLMSATFVSYKLSDTLSGDERANPFVRPGDVVSVSDADHIYVVGNVFQPRAIALKEPITVSRAIAMAGGEQRDTKRDRVRIIRELPGNSTKLEVYVDLEAIEKRQAVDVLLQANDIVDVPTSTGKSLVRSLLGTIVPMAAQLPIRVIP